LDHLITGLTGYLAAIAIGIKTTDLLITAEVTHCASRTTACCLSSVSKSEICASPLAFDL
jgi:hypothetical protein